MNWDVAHHLGHAPCFRLQKRANARGRTLGNENNAGASNDAPDEILLAGKRNRLLGDDPASLDLGQGDLDGSGSVFDL